MYISEPLKEQIRTLVEQGYFRDAENPSWVAEQVHFINGNIYLGFIDHHGNLPKEEEIEPINFKLPEWNMEYKERDND